MKKKIVKFLDYEIVNTGNIDGWVITKKGKNAKLWECNLGNYNDVEQAKKDCVIYFMIARPDEFSAELIFRISYKTHAYMNWYKFVGVCMKEDIVLPVELSMSDNYGILYNGKEI